MTAVSTSVTVRRATRDDTDPLISVLAEAFFAGPVADWLIPDHDDRRAVYQRYFELVLHHGLEHGHVDTTIDLSAVAIWYPRPEPPRGTSPEHQVALEAATGVYAPKFTLLEAMFEAFHPREPHHYLAYVAVSPEQQGRGVGAALLNSYHRRLDAVGMPAYLEASNMRNRRLYLRLGYRAGPPLILPTSGPTIWRMWRGTPTATGPAAFPATEPLSRRRAR
ncbi:GNAT family N-acetyltransferase [Micromonospora coxensis]|uniref:Acetyltransferase (GNAT) family protein n=1 Tax=Micromonospora coxensis TaxID=356852 RepID=A0A1C5GXX9_9ACTN|nr:GNAT family N-acetyltransferase [Micromonospora coxensis]SCG38669.1 Acetyltransferase (GNAT) family protein [Micromonospora coxensis]